MLRFQTNISNIAGTQKWQKTDRVTKQLTNACESRSDKLAFVREGKGLLRVLQEK
jgi:hypothetical protein